MENLDPKKLYLYLFFLLFYCINTASAVGQNSVQGMIFDDNLKPVSNINVELLDDFERLLGKTKTNSGGIFFFSNLSAGIYYIQVRTAGTVFQEVKERIELGVLNRALRDQSGTPVGIIGSEVRQITFKLTSDPRYENRISNPAGVVFVQQIPAVAQKIYKEALVDLEGKKTDEAFAKLKQAVAIFPDYFYALEKLGEMYLSQKKFEEAEIILKRAVEVNPKSFTNFFNLAVSQNKQDKKKDAVDSLRLADQIIPNSVNANLLLGIIERDLKNFVESEEAFLKAKKFSNNQFPDVHWNLALLYYHNLKRFDDAADELELYLKSLSKEDNKESKEKINQVKKLIKTLRDKSR